MKSKYIKSVEVALHQHIMNALLFLYKMAEVGDNPLALGECAVSYSDGAQYDITEIDFEFTGTKGEGYLIAIQTEEDTSYTDKIEVSGLQLETLIDILEALEEITGTHYPATFVLPKAK